MSTPHLPPELLDHIIDLLRDSQAVLRNCCLVSKSWIPHIRRHLFVGIGFDTTERLRSWKETFLDPSTSPAKYTKTLIIRCIQAVTAADAEEGGWIRGFSSVECLEVSGESAYPDGSMISLLPFRGFSPALKSLRVNLHFLPSSQVFDLVLSFPLLEDLNVMSRNMSIDDDDDDDNDSSHGLSTVVQPSSPPMTGFLELFERGGMGSIARRLMSLPGGIHFQNLALKWSSEEDVLLSMALVDKCSHTLEYLEIACGFRCGCTSIMHLRLHRRLISVSSRFGVSFDRPLEGDKAQRIGFSGRITAGRLDHHDAPNNHTRTSGLSANHDLPPI